MKEYLNDALNLLKDFVNMDSGSSDIEDVNKFADRVEYEFGKIGIATSRIKQKNTGDFIEFTVGSGNKKILLLGHMDTVFPSGTTRSRSFSIKNNILLGPGVLDMKGGMVVLYAVKNVMNRLPDDTQLSIFLNSDEEIGSKYSKDKILHMAKDAVACLSFEPAKPGTLTTERKGIISFKICLHGIPSHSGVNYDKGRSAIEEISHKICRLYNLSDRARDISVNVGKLTGGSKINIVAEYAEAEAEIRYFDKNYRDKLYEEVENIINTNHVDGVKASIEILSERPPLVSNYGNKRLFQMAKTEANKLGRNINERKTGGGGDASFIGSEGIPVIDGLGPEGENSHTKNEFAIIDSFPFKTELASQMILNIAKGY